VLLAGGYRGPSEIKGNALVHEYRRTAPRGTQVLQIQLDKRELPRFIINLYVEPSEGMQAVMRDGGTIISGRLKARAGATSRSWFRADRSWWERVVLRRSDTLENEAVQQCLSLLPEVDAWWDTQSASPHISSWPVNYVPA